MNPLEAVFVTCPYCGQSVELLVDCSQGEQDYIEDCQVCCRPMQVSISLSGQGAPQVQLKTEND